MIIDQDAPTFMRVGRKGPTPNKYVPHQNLGEQARRLKQIRNGHLRGEVVSDGARFSAYGIVAPPETALARPGRIVLP